MSKPIVSFDENAIKDNLKELVRKTVRSLEYVNEKLHE